MPASSITTILNRLGEADIILPYMTDANLRPLIRRVGSWVFARIINLMFGNRIRYYNSMVPRRDLLNRIHIEANGYSLQAECVAKLLRAGASYIQVGVPHGHGVANTGSHALRPRNILNVFRAMLALKREVGRIPPLSTASESDDPTVARREL